MTLAQMSNRHHNTLRKVLRKIDGDYDPWGNVNRWENPNLAYPDCSGGCKFFYALESRDGELLGADWGVCGNPKSHRFGLLTFEHQGCQEAKIIKDKQ